MRTHWNKAESVRPVINRLIKKLQANYQEIASDPLLQRRREQIERRIEELRQRLPAPALLPAPHIARLLPAISSAPVQVGDAVGSWSLSICGIVTAIKGNHIYLDGREFGHSKWNFARITLDELAELRQPVPIRAGTRFTTGITGINGEIVRVEGDRVLYKRSCGIVSHAALDVVRPHHDMSHLARRQFVR